MIRQLLARWADRTLQDQIRDLQSELEAERRRLAVANAEIESMAAVLARDRARIEAEGAAYVRQRAEAEGVMNDQRDREGHRRFTA